MSDWAIFNRAMAAAAPHLGDGPMSDPSYLVQTVIDLGRNGMTMDVKETLDLQNALKPWIRRAKAHINQDPDLVALMTKCLNGDGDVRVVYYVVAACFAIECYDFQQGKVSEVFRQYLTPSVPPDAGGFTVPEDLKVQ